MEKKKYPIGADHYELYEEVGQGVSASVHRAMCVPLKEVVAIKILDFERNNADLSNISREVQTMILVDHPNVLKSHCSFVSDHNLWVVMPFMAGGSCLHILKAAYPDGFEEAVIATILREVLKGLEYLHHHGHIHRDVKAGNILIDSRGTIKLGDFGVSACLFDSGDRQRMRNTFVGTPCWMAPEVMEQLHGYDFKADIWSFGITALELAHGHAPFSKYPPMKVLLMTLQNAPPGLDYERDKKFSKNFKQMIASCLVKDPSKRPSSKKLLKHSFFKQARSSDYIARTVLEGLPDLGDRMKALKRKEEDMLAQKKIPDGQKEEISQNEYKRGISGWNFNLEDVKAQASLIQDAEDGTDTSIPGGSCSSLSTLVDSQEKHSASVSSDDIDLMQNRSAHLPLLISSPSFATFRSEKSDDDSSILSPRLEPQKISPCRDDTVEGSVSDKPAFEVTAKLAVEDTTGQSQQKKGDSAVVSNLPESVTTTYKAECDKLQNVQQHGDDTVSAKAPKPPPTTNSEEVDEKTKIPVVQQRGRFKVTSENVDLERVPSPILQKSHSMQVLYQYGGVSSHVPPSDATTSTTLSSSSLFSQLYYVLQTNSLQRDNILSLMKQISGGDATANRSVDTGSTMTQMLEASHDREKDLLQEITELQWRLISAQDELHKYKPENS